MSKLYYLWVIQTSPHDNIFYLQLARVLEHINGKGENWAVKVVMCTICGSKGSKFKLQIKSSSYLQFSNRTAALQ